MTYAKFIVAVLGAALEGLNGVVPAGTTAHLWIGFALAVVTAFGVWFVPNAQAKQNHTVPHAGR